MSTNDTKLQKYIAFIKYARVLELVDKRDLKSLAQKACGFDSRSAHQLTERTVKFGICLLLAYCTSGYS